MFRVPDEFRRYCQGNAELPHRGATLQVALQHLAKQYPELGSRVLDEDDQLMPHLVVLHNGDVITSVQATNRSITTEDILEIYTAASGG